MKKLFVLLMVLVMLTAVGSTALAAGNVYFEAALKGTEKTEAIRPAPFGTEKNEYDLSDYTIGGLYSLNRFILGAEYSFGANEEEVDHTMWNARVGYICLGSPQFYVFPVVSLLGISQKDDNTETDVSATMVGVDAVWNITDTFNLYGSLGYALSASLESTGVLSTKEESVRTIVLKGNYSLTDNLALSVSYRNLNLAGKLEAAPKYFIDNTVNLATFAAGVSYHF